MRKIPMFVMLALIGSVAGAVDVPAPLRDVPGAVANPVAPPMTPMENQDLKRARNYPMQAPTIPHHVDNYQVDKNSNQCMACHSRRRVDETQAPMVSVTHYMDRDGNFLAEVSPRRYFCNQCHVPQHVIQPGFESVFKDMDMLVQGQRGKKK